MMIPTKLQEVIAELRAAAAERLRLADALEAIAKNPGDGSAPSVAGQASREIISSSRKVAKAKSYLALAVDVLREQRRPMHITEIVPMVTEKRGEVVTRASVESSLVRGMESKTWRGVIKRTAPSTFMVEH